jgi:hypothetical protein
MDDKIRKPVEGEMFIESPDSQQSEYKELRPLLYAMSYGAGSATLNRMAAEAGLTPEAAKKLLDEWATRWPRVKDFVNRYHAARPSYVFDRFDRRRHFNVPHNEPSTRWDSKPPQTTFHSRCQSNCTHWDIGQRRWYCDCKQTSIIANDDYPSKLDIELSIDFARAELLYAALHPEEVQVLTKEKK